MALDTTLRTSIANNVPYTAAAQHTTGHQNPEPETSLPMFNVNATYEYAYPNAVNLLSAFKKRLCSIIIRRGYEASIMVSFPQDPTQCRLVLDVKASEVVPLAMKLYGAEIRLKQQRRAVILPSGICMTIFGMLRLDETEITGWDEVFGDSVIKGVRYSLPYQDEVRRGIGLSECLVMEIPGSADCPARITLFMDPFTLGEIYAQLWPS